MLLHILSGFPLYFPNPTNTGSTKHIRNLDKLSLVMVAGFRLQPILATTPTSYLKKANCIKSGLKIIISIHLP